MPPRFTYWTIILDGRPTAFRAAERDQLLPTLKQLQSRNPDAVMKWFAHGRIWESPEEMWQLQARLRAEAREKALTERRGREWRPGGQHKDPREKFKRETFQARKRREKKAANLGGSGPGGGGQGFGPATGEPRGPATGRGFGPATGKPRGPATGRGFGPAKPRPHRPAGKPPRRPR